MDFKTLIRAMSMRPADMGLPSGSLRGLPADVIVIDADTPWVLDPADSNRCRIPHSIRPLLRARGADYCRRADDL
jgi:hypothetical protein